MGCSSLVRRLATRREWRAVWQQPLVLCQAVSRQREQLEGGPSCLLQAVFPQHPVSLSLRQDPVLPLQLYQVSQLVAHRQRPSRWEERHLGQSGRVEQVPVPGSLLVAQLGVSVG